VGGSASSIGWLLLSGVSWGLCELRLRSSFHLEEKATVVVGGTGSVAGRAQGHWILASAEPYAQAQRRIVVGKYDACQYEEPLARYRSQAYVGGDKRTRLGIRAGAAHLLPPDATHDVQCCPVRRQGEIRADA
jgi:hypothetical protein